MSKKFVELPMFGLLLLLLIIASTPAGASSQKYTAISCDETTTIALDENGNVWLWGWVYDEADSVAYEQHKNEYQAYICDTYRRVQATPTQLSLNDIIAISGGNLALKKDGTVWSWGLNEWGELGDGTTVSTSTPVQVKGLDHVIAISSENVHCLALKSDGTVWAWGGNDRGQLGDGTLTDRYTPVQVKGLTNVTAIYGGMFAVKDDGSVWTWGNTILDVDSSGRLRDPIGCVNCKTTPFQVSGISNVRDIDASGGSMVVVARDDGTVWSWGLDRNGSLGGGNVITDNFPFIVTPVQATNLTDVKAVSADVLGWGMALKDDGTVWAWGYNWCGRFGTGKIDDIEPVPIKVPGLDHVIAIDGKGVHSVFLKEDGSIWACGSNYAGSVVYGNVSEGPDAIVSTPVKILGPDEVSTSTAQPTPTVKPGSTTTVLAINSSATSQPGQTGLPIPSMSFGTVLVALTMAAIYGVINRKK
jgi:alpha-tubulin suppressor-like RCC1 family protein